MQGPLKGCDLRGVVQRLIEPDMAIGGWSVGCSEKGMVKRSQRKQGIREDWEGRYAGKAVK